MYTLKETGEKLGPQNNMEEKTIIFLNFHGLTNMKLLLTSSALGDLVCLVSLCHSSNHQIISVNFLGCCFTH